MSAASCTLTPEGTVTNVPVRSKISVCYQFRTGTKESLALPYAVAVNGNVLSDFIKRPMALSKSNRCINLRVDTGSKVVLFLNSDAYPRFRQHPVYELTVGTDDVHVDIKEQLGCRPDIKPVVGQAACETDSNGTRVLKYKALLTGDIWMSISHRYTRQEAESLLPQDLSTVIRQAVLRIFNDDGLSERFLEIDFAANGEAAASKLKIKFDQSIDSNAHQNIGVCPLLKEVLPRTHPRAFAVLFTEARASDVVELSINSSWRPMLGAIVHRVGLGIDVNYVCSATSRLDLDRSSLTTTSTVSGKNVSQNEKKSMPHIEAL
ncbi:hypothetical protein AB4Z19_25950 [Pseudoduganella sp. RAF19]|uniref:hypothetical protein n=2 Tax=unclassified Pseudoduganella TaxID=2637179 RepID=UPI003F99155B